MQAILREDAHRAYDHYEELLNQDAEGEPLDPNRTGMARELSRINLSLNFYTQWYWKIDLHNLLNFLALRADPHAQHEIRVYAETILELIVKPWVPLTYEAFCDYRLNARTLSAQALAVVRTLVAKRQQEAEALRSNSGLSSREWLEIMKTLGLEE